MTLLVKNEHILFEGTSRRKKGFIERINIYNKDMNEGVQTTIKYREGLVDL